MNKKSLLFLNIFFFFIIYAVSAQNSGRLSGFVIDKTSQQPLAKVTVTLTSINQNVFTDSVGFFRFLEIPLGTYSVAVSYVGYKTQTKYNIVVNAGNENTLSFELEPSQSQLEEVVIQSSRKTARAATLETPLSVQRLTTEELRSNPGGNFDISKVIQTLPGVGGGPQGGSFRNDIIIRGGAPNENVFYLDGIEIPVLNHFQTQGSSGGPQGMLNVSLIEDVKLSSSAFDARYDNAMSSVFQFKQKTANGNRVQGNVRLSATELAATLEGPLSANKKTTFLASVRRSYLQLLFSLIDLPIRPNFWDFQTKISHQLDKKTTISFIGIGALDEFRFATLKDATPEKIYTINSNPLINQWNYTAGVNLKKIVRNGFLNVALSRNSFDNDIKRYEDNEKQLPSELTLSSQSRETENKLRFDVNKNRNGLKFSYGIVAQVAEYSNNTFNVIRKEIRDSSNNIVQAATTVNFNSPLASFLRYGAFGQVGKRFFDDRLGVNAGIRTDMNTFTTTGNNGLKTLSPRLSLSYVLADKWTVNASVGRYFKIAPYTILGFANNNGQLVNKNIDYLRSNQYVAGVEYLPNNDLRFTIEGFYKQYANVPVSVRNGISLSNLGGDFSVLGNEAVVTTGRGRAYGAEFFAQKKLTNRSFGIVSYTIYKSEYSGLNNILIPSNWDNRHLLSITWGYKFKRNWELGLKFRYQGGSPFTDFDSAASRLNFLSLGEGVLNFNQVNANRFTAFNAGDVRIDKKWNFKNVTLDLFLDVTNWYGARSPALDSYTFKRNADNTAFVTTDGLAIKPDGSNAIPVRLKNDEAMITPTIGFIVEF